jgi:hypothetical protein
MWELLIIPIPRTPVNTGTSQERDGIPAPDAVPLLVGVRLGWLLVCAYLGAAGAAGSAGVTSEAAPPDWASFIPPLR